MYFLWAGIWKGIGVRPLGNAKSALRLDSFSVIVSEGATMNGRRLVPRQRVVTLCNNFCKGGVPYVDHRRSHCSVKLRLGLF